MVPFINVYAQFTFSNPFAGINGVYKTVDITSFEAAVNVNKVNFVNSLYKPAGLDGSTYPTDYLNWANSQVYQLQSTGANPTTLYVPDVLFASIPDLTVSEYSYIYISAPIGVFKDSTTYSWIQNQVDSIIASVTGQTGTTRFFANPANNVYLTDTAYAAMDAARTATIQKIQPIQTQLNSALLMIENLKSQVNALQTIVESLKG